MPIVKNVDLDNMNLVNIIVQTVLQVKYQLVIIIHRVVLVLMANTHQELVTLVALLALMVNTHQELVTLVALLVLMVKNLDLIKLVVNLVTMVLQVLVVLVLLVLVVNL